MPVADPGHHQRLGRLAFVTVFWLKSLAGSCLIAAASVGFVLALSTAAGADHLGGTCSVATEHTEVDCTAAEGTWTPDTPPSTTTTTASPEPTPEEQAAENDYAVGLVAGVVGGTIVGGQFFRVVLR